MGILTIFFNASWSNTAVGTVDSFEFSSNWTFGWISDFVFVFIVLVVCSWSWSCSLSSLRRSEYFSVDFEDDVDDCDVNICGATDDDDDLESFGTTDDDVEGNNIWNNKNILFFN